MRVTRPTQPGRPPLWPLPGTTGAATSHPWLRRARRVLVAFLLVIILFTGVSAVAWWRLSATVTAYPGAHFNRGANAVWLEHTWAGDYHMESEYDALAQRLRVEQISYVFAHVGPLNSDGTIPADRALYAARLATALHDRVPGIHVLAWIGQVEIAGGYPASESVDLSNYAVRMQIVATAAHFVDALGFDGVHYDIEPILNNSPRFLDLLAETRSALRPGAIISIAAEKWAPNAHIAEWLYSIGKASAWWTSYYYAKVATYVDQLVPMLYNTGVPLPQMYQLTVQQETRNILEAARSAPHPPQVIFGIPAYSGDSPWFHSNAENLRTGLLGVTAGLNSDRSTAPFAGVALYRYGVTSASEWATYDRLWLGK